MEQLMLPGFKSGEKMIDVFLFSGQMGVGKTTSANLLKELLDKQGKYAEVFSFADGVKDCAINCFGWDGEKDERGRKLLQLVGTDVGRWYNPDIWVFVLIEEILDHPRYPNLVIIIDDWRFPNEDFSQYKNFYRPFTFRIFSNVRGEPNSHISENALQGYEMDWVIENNGTIPELRNSLKKILGCIQ